MVVLDEAQTSAWAVPVWTDRPGGGQMLVLCAAMAPTKEAAVTLVMGRPDVGADNVFGEAYPLSDRTVEALGMQPGETVML